MSDKTKELQKMLTFFCLGKNIEATKEQIEIQATMIARRYAPDVVKRALDELFYSVTNYPDASLISSKIEQMMGHDDIKSAASEKASEIISKIHECGFDISWIKAEIGEDYFNAIGAETTVRGYGKGDVSLGVLKAHIRDSIIPTLKKHQREERSFLGISGNGQLLVAQK